ncbi:MAG: SUF system NifU family Fe-S cluster assembly protein [Nitrospirae bacterium CG18_big_fil_WC_8_21_14_2_50_70_55]|nr:MAG: SUF system NifU family Fe-S cluster assembly protein [Nitrospirae bacterium CG18_big_fil_WC_8_21_14_2_50_70_55]PIU77327.1 MAG: SUF system NifU family Fe-S cluster assembly protein [Nitrospirae bacterium CG06_land_8_20_14_3_00_70_43]PIW83884.1 MAG: SUF system NifU family Fe-S cluster assembly protein [Nitrospirae bacterium CG_4_8_14_3_um_filter_70_85]
MNDLRALYEDVILDHNRRPRNFQHKPGGANHQASGFNPLCGDEFTVYLQVENNIVTDVGFEGVGCAIAVASTSLMTEAIKGKPIAEVEALFQSVHHLLTHKGEAAAPLGKLAVLAGVHEFPMRIKCATLGWHVMKAAIENQHETVCTE